MAGKTASGLRLELTRLEQKLAIILEKAEQILIRRGKNATMGDIAQALDMDKSSLYYYFKGIPDILNVILAKEYYDFSVNIHDIRRENKPHVDVLKEMVRIILEFYHGNIATEFSPQMVLQTLRGAIFGVCSVWRDAKPDRDRIPRIVDQLFRMYA